MQPLEVSLKKFISKQDDPSAILNRAFEFVTAPIVAVEEEEYNQQYQLPAHQLQALSLHRQHVHEEEDKIKTSLYEEEIFRLTAALERERSTNQELKNELAKKSRELTNQNLQVETLTLHLNNFRESDTQTFLHSKKDRVMETESLKTRLSRAERDRDSLAFQIQEMERRHALQLDEESQLHAEYSSRVLESERRASNAELARQRAEAESTACRQQLEHWKSATKYAQEEIASLRAQFSSSGGGGGTAGGVEFKRQFDGYSNAPLQLESEDSRAAANALLRRQQQQVQQQQGVDWGAARQRLQEIASEVKELEDNMENVGNQATRTLQQRLTREKWRRRIEELKAEAATLQQQQ